MFKNGCTDHKIHGKTSDSTENAEIYGLTTFQNGDNSRSQRKVYERENKYKCRRIIGADDWRFWFRSTDTRSLQGDVDQRIRDNQRISTVKNASSSIGTTTPCWVLAYSTVVEYSQQEGFYRVPLPAVRQTPNLEDQ